MNNLLVDRSEYWTDETSPDIAECRSFYLPSSLRLRVCNLCGRGIVGGNWRRWRQVATLVDQRYLVEMGPFLNGRPVCRECWELWVSGQNTSRG